MPRSFLAGVVLFAAAVAVAQTPAPKPTDAKAVSERFGELRRKARDKTITPAEQAELEAALKAREWANRPTLPPAVIPRKNPNPPRAYHVDNERGSDAASGAAGSPFKTIAKGVAQLKPGDTLHLTKNATPYREALTLMDVSGNAEQPITVDGHGATLTGCDPLKADWVSAGRPGLYKSDQHLANLEEFGDEAKLIRVFFVFDGVQQRMNRTSKGKKAGFKSPDVLKPGEWTFDDKTRTFYVQVAGTLADAKVEAPYRRNGVTVRGRAGVSHVTVKNLVVKHVLNDGYNLHGVGTAIRFENVGALECGDDGCSPHETIECSLDGFWSVRNSTGIGLGNQSIAKITNAHFEGNFAYDFAMGHAPIVELTHSVIVTTEPDAKPVGTIYPQDLKLTFDNVQVNAPGGTFIVGPRSTFTARRLTAVVPGWEVSGAAAVSDSVLGGRVIECKAGGTWAGRNNVYGSDTRFVGFEVADAVRKAVGVDLLKLPGQPFPPAGADPTAMRIPPRPW